MDVMLADPVSAAKVLVMGYAGKLARGRVDMTHRLAPYLSFHGVVAGFLSSYLVLMEHAVSLFYSWRKEGWRRELDIG